MIFTLCTAWLPADQNLTGWETLRSSRGMASLQGLESRSWLPSSVLGRVHRPLFDSYASPVCLYASRSHTAEITLLGCLCSAR